MSPPDRRRTAARIVAGLTALALGAAGCADSGTARKRGADSTTLVAYTGQTGGYQVNFNPFAATSIEGPGTIFEPLFHVNALRVGDPVPRLGTAYAWNPTGTRLDVTLRGDATFTDGTRFTAKDVVFTFAMIKKFPTMNPGGWSGEVRAVDDTHVTFTFTEPSFLDAPQILGRTFIVPAHLWAAKADPSRDVVEQPIGTGPFMLADFTAQAFTLRANPTYWGGEPALKQIRYVSLPAGQSGADALRAGTVDWQTGAVPDIAHVEKNYPGYAAVSVPMNQMALFSCANADLGCTGPQTDPAVRRAIYYAIDRAQVNALAFENAAGEVSPGGALTGRDAKILSAALPERTAPMSPRLDRATALLQAAGWVRGPDGIYAKGGVRLQLSVRVVDGWTDYLTAVTAMARQLRRAGIAVTAQRSSWNQWSYARDRGEFNLLLDSLQPGPAADPYYLYQRYFSTATTKRVGESTSGNVSRFVHPQVERALLALRAIDPKDAARRQPHLDTIQRVVAANVPYIPILTGVTTSEYNARKFSGWPTTQDLYAVPAIWSRPDASQIFLRLRPAG